jgi:hypothetical protein
MRSNNVVVYGVDTQVDEGFDSPLELGMYIRLSERQIRVDFPLMTMKSSTVTQLYLNQDSRDNNTASQSVQRSLRMIATEGYMYMVRGSENAGLVLLDDAI